MPRPFSRIAVIVPAHDEAGAIARCVDALRVAAHHARSQGIETDVVIVLDDCSDDTGAIARRHGARTLEIVARNVGRARAVGAMDALERGAEWLCFTDADSVVAPDWLTHHIALGGDAVCGTVAVEDWSGWRDGTRALYESAYTDSDGHRHVHGANLGISAGAYRRSGGFQALSSSEDVALVRALIAQGASIVWSAGPRVVTSARRAFKCAEGFGAALAAIERAVSMAGPAPDAAA